MLFENIDSYPSDRPGAITIGNFDGCHRGHQQLLAKTLAFAQAQGCVSVALTFDPRPEDWFRRGQSDQPLLFSPAQKSRALAECGIERHIVQPFDQAFSEITHHQFITAHLKERLNAKAVIIGENFCFGHKRQGDAAFLKAEGERQGFEVFVIPAAHHDAEPISSTRIRAAIQSGHINLAGSLLGRPYLLEGEVEKGDQLGRQLGFPTANIGMTQQLLPKAGVYCAWMQVGDPNPCGIFAADPKNRLKAVVNIGYRPSVSGQNDLRIEAHVLGVEWSSDALYGKQVGLYFVERLRDEQKFSDLDQLKQQIAQDIATAEKHFATL